MENELIRKLAGAIEEQTKKAKSKSYDTQATVKRVEGETVWVHIPGGVDETPVSKTIACSAGDTVQVRVTNGRGFIVGNGSAPPTDDTTAIISKEIATEARYTAETALEDAVTAHDAAISATESAATAGRAASVAQAAADAAQETANSKKTVFVTEPTPPYHVGDLWVRFDPEVFDMVDSDGNSLIDDQGDLFEAAILKEAAAYVCMVPKTAGQEFSESDFELATADNGLREWFWHDANGAHILGDVTGFRNDLTSTGMKIVDTSTENTIASFGTETSIRTTDGVELAHFGYDMGTSSGGSLSVAPFYTLGSRVNSSTVGNFSVAEGNQTVASGYVSHAEGETTTSSGYIAHAEGTNTTASGHYSHAEGTGCSASGIGAHAEGISSTASGDGAHAQNYITRAASDYQTAIGKANKYDYDNEYALIIGNGTADNARSNALTVDWSGNVNVPTGAAYKVNGTSLIDLIYPVGSIYMSVNNTSPQTLFGGTWQQIQDTFLLAAGSTYTAGGTGGTASNTLTSNNLPRLTGTVNYASNIARNSSTNYPIIEAASGIASRSTRTGRNAVEVASGSMSVKTSQTVYDTLSLTIGQTTPTALDNLPPYLAVYVWKRTA